ncbi:DeoR/GlpR family DNA-binding transcription regulator (plasmid) [Agrobacterium tumefaciens]|uniref:DeoR/GlpR family DNA-binding transcription regulator n=1 Tax=Agrobacterium tumefaciens TaxID=358 RepID=UPI000E0B6EE3|nr:DeoR/GlpR family DNA-binding transcription regulator [Agrobacterium tumefaciens]WQE43518.1 DeoR/GlpR family DNA-binding transcription regulator [Agrobacterium tumefaciens]
MRPSLRQEQIFELLNQTREMSVEDLAERLEVSRETIRRDLTKMDAEGKLRKVHGGARAAGTPNETAENEGPFATRMAENYEAKKKIAIAASRLIRSDDSVFIDTGTTTIVMADELARIQNLVVITNSYRIAVSVSNNTTHKVFLIGGAYGADAGESLGPLALEQIMKFRARYAIITVAAVDSNSLMDFDLQEAEIARTMIERADKLIVLADHSKFDRRAVFEVAPLAAVDYLVTDREPTPQVAASLHAANIEVIVA